MSASSLKRAGVIAFLLAASTFAPAQANRTSAPAPGSPAQRAQQARGKRFVQLWLSRRTKRVAPQLVQMLKSERAPYRRNRIIIALGRLEDPAPAPLLRSLLGQSQRSGIPRDILFKAGQVDPVRLQLALGRIEARQLRGAAKLNRIARVAGTTWLQLRAKAKRMRARIGEDMGFYEVRDSREWPIVHEFYDVLYRMGKRGEDIRALGAFDLLLFRPDPQILPDAIYSHPQELLNAAKMSDRQEIEFWLQRVLPPRRTRFDVGHLLDLGPQARPRLADYLRRVERIVSAQPQLVAKNLAYTTLLDAASASGDKRLVPALQSLGRNRDKAVAFRAKFAIRDIQNGGRYDFFP